MCGVLIFGNTWYFYFYFFIINIEIFFIYLKDPISQFVRYLMNSKNENLLRIWNGRIKITKKDLEHNANLSMIKEKVDHHPDLAKKYLKKMVSCSEIDDHINLLNDMEIRIIEKNKSVILMYNDRPVGAVVRDAALKNILEHFGAKIKSIVKGHPILRRGKTHTYSGKLVGDGKRANRLDSGVGNYVYKTSNPKEQKILCDNGITLAKWLFEFGKQHLSWAAISYEKFKECVELNEDEIIGAVFCAENYEAIGHTDNDRSDYAVGYVYEEGIVKEGFFFYFK